MRRKTDFVLEEAAWPALLLDNTGAIIRANRAARETFGTAVEGSSADLESLWTGEGTSPGQFLMAGGKNASATLKLRLENGNGAVFLAHLTQVDLENATHFVLQLLTKPGGSSSDKSTTTHHSKPAKQQVERADFEVLNADWPVLLVDRDGNIIKGNVGALNWFGPAIENAGATLTELWSPENGASVQTVLNHLVTDEPFKIRLFDGEYGEFSIHICPAGRDNLLLLQFLKLAEVPVNRSEAAEFLLENADWPVILAGKSGAVIHANRAGTRLFGSGAEPNTALADVLGPENWDRVQTLLANPTEDPTECPVQLSNGTTALFFAQCCRVGPKHNCLLQLFKARSSSAANNAEPGSIPVPSVPANPVAVMPGRGGILEANLAHKQKLDCALQLARSVALDFNNALTSILGHTSLLLTKAEAKHPWRNSLVEIEKAASKAAEIANDLAAFSRQEKDNKVHLAGNLNTVIERTIDIFHADHSDLEFSTQFERKLFTASFDEARLQQVFLKIFENSAEAIKKDGRITVQTRNLELTEPTHDRTAKLGAGNYICVEISDNGEGIAADVVSRVFEPFFSTRGGAHRGLGLAWVYGIITNHGGAVALSSEPGVGTSVRIYLPANRNIVKEASVSTDNLNGTETILLVDDEDLLLTMGQMVLSSFGYTVLTANSGQRALELFSEVKAPIHLVITDLVMPNMSGRELTERILRIAPDTRILWSSGYVRATNVKEQECYLQKPFTSQDLLRRVKQALAK